DARGHTITAPDTAEELLSIGRELRDVAAAVGDRERIAAGHNLSTLALLMLGDMRSAEQEIAASVRIAEELRQVPLLWEVTGDRALLALAEGRFDEGAELADAALVLGQQAMPDAAVPIHVLQTYTLREARGGLETMEAPV